MPIGLARVAELHHGFDVDPLIVGVGRARSRASASWSCGWSPRGGCRRRRRGVCAARRSHDVCSPAVTSPRASTWEFGSRSVPVAVRRSTGVWTTVLGATLTIALLAGLWSFQASLQHMLDSPRLYGWNWSVKSGAPALPDVAAPLVPAFAHDPVVSAFASGTITQAELGLERGRRDGHAAGARAAWRRRSSRAASRGRPAR